MKKRSPLRIVVLIICIIALYLLFDCILYTRLAVKVLLTVGIVFLGEQTFDAVMQKRRNHS